MASRYIINYLIVSGVLTIFCAVIGAGLMGLGYARQKRKASTGALLGGVIGASIILLMLGALGIATSLSRGDFTLRLLSVATVGLGLLLLLLLRGFGPRPEKKLATREFAESQQQPAPQSHKTDSVQVGESSQNIFISYRRDDSPDVTGRIYDVLVERYGAPSIFKDVDSIPFGVDFRKHLQSVVAQSDVVLVIIGDRWLTMTDSAGHSRLQDQGDFVRIEIESALQRDIRIVPLLVRDSSMPKEEELPTSIKDLAYRNGISVRHDPDFHNDMERLIRALDDMFTQGRFMPPNE